MADLDVTIHGEAGMVSVHTFQSAITHSMGLLREFDSALSRFKRGALRWYVQGLSSNGDLHLYFSARLRPALAKRKDAPRELGTTVANTLLSGFDAIENRSATPPYLSEFGMLRAQELAALIGKNGARGFRFSASDRHVEVTSRTSENLANIIPIRRKSIGSVEGHLETIDIHKKPRFIVYHSISNRAVSCNFDPELSMDKVKALLGKRVIVRGILHKNINGDTLRVDMDQIEPIDMSRRFSTKEDVSELPLPDFTDVESTKEYLRRIRG